MKVLMEQFTSGWIVFLFWRDCSQNRFTFSVEGSGAFDRRYALSRTDERKQIAKQIEKKFKIFEKRIENLKFWKNKHTCQLLGIDKLPVQEKIEMVGVLTCEMVSFDEGRRLTVSDFFYVKIDSMCFLTFFTFFFERWFFNSVFVSGVGLQSLVHWSTVFERRGQVS